MVKLCQKNQLSFAHGAAPWRVSVLLGKDGQRVADEILTEVDGDGTVRVLTEGYVPVTYLGKLHGYRLEAGHDHDQGIPAAFRGRSVTPGESPVSRIF